MRKPQKGTVLTSLRTKNTFKVTEKRNTGDEPLYVLTRTDGQETAQFVESYLLRLFIRA